MSDSSNNIYVEKAMRSANRAAQKVLTESLLHNRPLPVWESGKVEYKVPTKAQIKNIVISNNVI